MPSLLLIASLSAGVYIAACLSTLVANYVKARKSGFPSVIIPFNQNNYVWIIVSVALRPLLRKYLPASVFNRIDLTIYGVEFHKGLALYDDVSAAKPEPSYALVTAGRFEVNTSDPEIAFEILRRPNDFRQHDLSRLFMQRFGKNVFTSDGDDWARQRKVVATTINERISRTIFNESIRQTDDLVDEVVGHNDAGDTIGMFDMMKKITINVLSGAGMGTPIDFKTQRDTKPKPGFQMTYIEAVKVVIDAVAGPIILPQWFLNHYPSFLPGKKYFHDLSVAMDEFPVHTRDLLDQERQRSLQSGETRSNIMSQLLKATEGGGGPPKPGHRAPLSDDETMGNLFVFTAAGFETTANSLAYALVLLARHPQWQSWMTHEIDALIPPLEDPASSSLDYAAIFPRATRVLAVMLETLRLYTPLVHIARQVHGPQSITTAAGATYQFPPQTTVYINLIALHLDPRVWRNLNLQPGESPSDRDELEFRPSRWLNPVGADAPLFQPPRGTYMPWSAGPRVCPGLKMAQVEFTSILLTLFRRHFIEAVPLTKEGGRVESAAEIATRLDEKIRDSMSIMTLQMKDVYDVTDADGDRGKGVKLRIRKRN